MKQFKIKVNGKEYDVEVDQVGGSTEVQSVSSVQAAPKAAPAAPAKATVTGSEGSIKLNAPMPGTILGVKAKVGDVVKKGDAIVILEAMKMENEIAAPEDGTVSSINVESGASVESGQLLATLS